MGRIFNQKQISLSLNFIVNVQTVYAKISERRHTINLKKKTFFIDTNWHFLNYKELSHFRNEKVAYSYEVESSTTTTMYLFKEI